MSAKLQLNFYLGWAEEFYSLTLINAQKILADSRGFGYFHLVNLYQIRNSDEIIFPGFIFLLFTGGKSDKKIY